MLDRPVELEPGLLHHPQRGVVLGPGEADDLLEPGLARRRSRGRRSPPRSRSRGPARRPGRSSPARPPARPRPWRRRGRPGPRARRARDRATATSRSLARATARCPPGGAGAIARCSAGRRPGRRASASAPPPGRRRGRPGRRGAPRSTGRSASRRSLRGSPIAPSGGRGGLGGDGVADPDAAAAQYLRAEAGAVHHPPHHARPGQALEVVAGLAQLDPLALDLADPEALAHQVVEADSPGQDVAARLRRGQLDPLLGLQRLQRLGLDQGEVVAGAPRRRPPGPRGRSSGRRGSPCRRTTSISSIGSGSCSNSGEMKMPSTLPPAALTPRPARPAPPAPPRHASPARPSGRPGRSCRRRR